MANHDQSGHQADGDGTRLRRIGLTFAAVSALGAIAVIVWASLFRAPATAGPVLALETAPLGAGDPGVGVSAEGAEPEDLQDLVKFAEDAELQFFDPEDESLRGQMTFARLEPRPNGRFFAESPEAWLLLQNGTSAQITARESSFRMPAGTGEPESGRFTGDVTIRLHRGRLETPESRAASEPVTTLTMDELHFDAALGQLRTTSEVRVEGRGVEGAFEGLEMVVDEASKRLAHLSTRGGGWLRQTPQPDTAAPGTQSRPAADGRVDPGEGRTDFYAARIDGGVTVERDTISMKSDQLEAWARLVDGALPADALAGFLSASGTGGTGQAGEPSAPDPAAPAMLRWAGRLVVEPRDSEPEALAGDALAGRFSSPATGLVEFRSAGSTGDVEATCASVWYGATSRRMTLSGAGASGVSLRSAGTGELVCGRLEIDLTSGVALMPGPGELRASALSDSRRIARTVAWQRRAEMSLRTAGEHVDLSGAWPLETAMFVGGVTAREGDAELTGDTVTASFLPSRLDPAAAELTRVVVAGSARAVAPGQGRLLGERVTVDFTTRASDGALSPTTILVEGRALAERGTEGISAEILTARLGRDPTTDAVRIESLEADLDVLVRGKGGEEALAEKLTADPLRGVYDLIGEPVTLRRGGAAVTGGSMRIDEIQERLTVFGRGELNYRESREEARGYQRVTVAWTGTMTFDGVMERAEFVGDCVVLAESDNLTRDTLRGERIIVEINLDDASGAASAGGDAEFAAFRRAQIIGEVEELGTGRTAQIESRRYRLDPESDSGLALEFLAYLDGPTLIADAATDTLMAPEAGRLLFEDRREEGTVREGPSTRGTTLFEWQGAARFDRGRGEAVMTREVRLRQKPAGESRVTELECERLDAKFAIPAGAPESDRAALRAQLTMARASGAVYAQQGTRELIADRLEFDAEAGIAQAWANEGNLVTIYDTERPIPLTGSVLRWDLTRDRIEWRDAGTTTAPR